MPVTDPGLSREQQRAVAVALFNLTWQYIDMPARTAADDDAMLNAAHAARYFWGLVGDATNAARGEWQLARVYAVLGRGEPALHHARRSLGWCEQARIGGFDLGFAHEALARAYTVAGDRAAAARHVAEADRVALTITDEEDRAWLLKNMETLR